MAAMIGRLHHVIMDCPDPMARPADLSRIAHADLPAPD
jgi:hypothetical protein